ncbi:MAG: aminotransferase class I/II-fold pyridoxal phosphate-dependent enzyme [Syntrophales bacterium]
MFIERFENRLILQEQSGLYRRPPEIRKRAGKYLFIGDTRCLNFASNDYLGLADSPALKRILARNIRKSGTSSSSSRLVTGNTALIREAEKACAQFFGYEDALFCPSGFQANLALLSALFEPGDLVLIDRHIHASSVKGVALSGADVGGFRHGNLLHLEKKLQQDPTRQAAVVTESLFSMDGDLLDTPLLARLKEHYGFLTIVDEAHAFGAIGPGGKGIATGVADIAIGTFGKAFGLFGAFILLPGMVREYLLNFSAPVLFTTALPSSHAGAVLETLAVVVNAHEQRTRLRDISGFMKASLRGAGFCTFGDAHILGVEIGNEQEATRVARGMRERGILVFPARYPTVPLHHAILRIGMTALHDQEDCTGFVRSLRETFDQKE